MMRGDRGDWFALVFALGTSAAIGGELDPDNRVPGVGAPFTPPASRFAQPAVVGSEPSVAAQRALDALAREGAAASVATPAAAEVAKATPVAATAPDDHRFVARAGESLSTALGAYLARVGWDLEWNSSQDFMIQRSYAVEVPGASDLRQTLVQILTPYRLSAVVHNAPSQRVVAVVAAASADAQP